MLEPAAPTVAPVATALQLVDWTFPEASFGTPAASILVSPHAPGGRGFPCSWRSTVAARRARIRLAGRAAGPTTTRSSGR